MLGALKRALAYAWLEYRLEYQRQVALMRFHRRYETMRAESNKRR